MNGIAFNAQPEAPAFFVATPEQAGASGWALNESLSTGSGIVTFGFSAAGATEAAVAVSIAARAVEMGFMVGRSSVGNGRQVSCRGSSGRKCMPGHEPPTS